MTALCRVLKHAGSGRGLQLKARIHRISRAAHLIVWFICLVVSLKANIRIIFSLRRHFRKLKSHNTIPENIRRQRELKLTANILFIVGIYLLLNLPVLFVAIYHQISGKDIITYNYYSWTETLAFLNSYKKSIELLLEEPGNPPWSASDSKTNNSSLSPQWRKKHGAVTWYTMYKVNTGEESLAVQWIGYNESAPKY